MWQKIPTFFFIEPQPHDNLMTTLLQPHDNLINHFFQFRFKQVYHRNSLLSSNFDLRKLKNFSLTHNTFMFVANCDHRLFCFEAEGWRKCVNYMVFQTKYQMMGREFSDLPSLIGVPKCKLLSDQSELAVGFKSNAILL